MRRDLPRFATSSTVPQSVPDPTPLHALFTSPAPGDELGLVTAVGGPTLSRDSYLEPAAGGPALELAGLDEESPARARVALEVRDRRLRGDDDATGCEQVGDLVA